jgi:acetyl-CoA carboxylase biotin carboxyl carrier protein
MNLDEVRRILELMREHELGEFELQQDGVTLRLRKHVSAHWPPSVPAVQPVAVAVPIPPPASPASTPVEVPAEAGPKREDVDLAIVKSPIVGTFYSASEPGAPPFVGIGQTVRRDQVLCIIEAMKLMNEIKAECDGELVKVYVENGQAVQYGERLFAIKPA